MKLLLTCIVKGDSEAQMFERMILSFKPYISGLVVAITGVNESFTEIKKLVHKHKGQFVVTTPESHPQIYSKDENGKWFFSSFAEARNVTFSIADSLEGFDYYLWADVDDVLINGQELEALVKRASELKIDSVFCTYWYAISVREDGTFDESCIQIDHLRERLLKPRTFKWISRLHEVAVPIDGNYKATNTLYDYNPKENRHLVWAHLSEKERFQNNAKRNIAILKLQIEDEEYKDPRTIKYLAQTYYDMNDSSYYDECLKLFGQYLQLSGWGEERSLVWQYIGNILSKKGDHKKAIAAYHKGIEESPLSHMHYIYLAKEYAEIGLIEHSNFWLDMVLRMDPPKTRTTIGNPLEVKYMAASLMYNRAQRELKLDEAIEWLKVRLKLGQQEDDGMLKTLEEAKMLNEAAKWTFNYAKWLKDNGHVSKVEKLLESLPPELGREAYAHYIANEVKEPKVWPKKSIVYYASWGADHFEGWSPKNMETGIGGSETAVIELAKRWVKAGYDVTVYGDPREDEGDYEGVHYRPWYEVNWNDTFNVLILWRSPHLLDKEIKANKLFYDAHDVESQINWTEERMKKVDKVFLKSRFHRAMLPKLPDNKAIIISNGINI